jgi:hypothetical protein
LACRIWKGVRERDEKEASREVASMNDLSLRIASDEAGTDRLNLSKLPLSRDQGTYQSYANFISPVWTLPVSALS